MNNGIPFTILLVDDDEDDRFFMNVAFEQVGYEAEVKKFIHGSDLLKYMEQVEAPLYPSLIVLDDHMPGLDAMQILSLLKGNPAYQHIPVVVYSGVLSFYREKELLSKGAYAYMEKGASINDSVHIAQRLKNLAEAKAQTR